MALVTSFASIAMLHQISDMDEEEMKGMLNNMS